jgi:anaphase-promoting complex subunit 1
MTWVQGHLATGQGTEYPTLSDIYLNATRDKLGGKSRSQLWTSLTPRTIMFEKLFARLRSTTSRFEAVVAMHECGFTAQVLESLPESILTSLQDIIAICQPSPLPSWPREMLALVGRTDVSGVLQPKKAWRVLGSNTNVSSMQILPIPDAC